ncbi:M15 family metallopeptidase [Actinomadura barringtoniae]|nr:M15 family metallopeptidase [Actinomadura barringtoniae]
MRSRSFVPALTVAAGLALTACSMSSTGASTFPSASTAQDDGRIDDAHKPTPFDVNHPAIRNLNKALLAALQKAATHAERDGVHFVVNSGWRSERYQRELMEQAVTRYGSREEAKRFVLSPEKSAHVKGRAVDIGPTDADSWLGRHGAAFGLCQTYANEMWHYELATKPGGECPPQRPDATAG